MGSQDNASTKLKCTNTEVVKAYCEEFNVYYREGATEAENSNLSYPNFLEVKRLSERYPEDTICCQFTTDYYLDEIYMDFKGGTEHLIDYKTNYIFEVPKINYGGIEHEAKNKITEFFKKLEAPEVVDPDYFVRLCIPRSNEVVTYRFELETSNPRGRCRVEARKNKNHIHMKVFGGNAVFEWIDLEKSNDR